MGEFRRNRSHTDRPVSLKRKLGVLALRGGAYATNDVDGPIHIVFVESMRPYPRQVPPWKESRVPRRWSSNQRAVRDIPSERYFRFERGDYFRKFRVS